MRRGMMLATVIMTAASIVNGGAAAAVSARAHPTIEVSPSVRSASYYAGHHSERDMVVTLCMVSRVADGSTKACENALESVVREVQARLSVGGCSGIPVC